jgi:hypothetical protein
MPAWLSADTSGTAYFYRGKCGCPCLAKVLFLDLLMVYGTIAWHKIDVLKHEEKMCCSI